MSRMIDNSEAKTGKENGKVEDPLFAPGAEVRVSDLVGNLRAVTHNPPAPIPAVRHNGPLRLGWYDWAVIAMIVSSMVAGFFCLLAGK